MIKTFPVLQLPRRILHKKMLNIFKSVDQLAWIQESSAASQGRSWRTLILNKSWHPGEIPEDWKSKNAVPMFKKVKLGK